jgi:hypothetical protein
MDTLDTGKLRQPVCAIVLAALTNACLGMIRRRDPEYRRRERWHAGCIWRLA